MAAFPRGAEERPVMIDGGQPGDYRRIAPRENGAGRGKLHKVEKNRTADETGGAILTGAM